MTARLIKASAYVGAVLTATAAGSAQADQVVKVGMIMTLSGPMASLGENIDKGAQLYLTQHGADLPKGVKLDVIRRDDTGPNPEVAKRLAQELIVRDRVQMLGGVVFTPNAAAIAPLTAEAKVPLVLMNASTSNLTRLSPYVIRVSYTQWQTSYTLGEWAARNGYKSVYTAVSDYAAGIDAEDAFVKAFRGKGGEIIGSVHMPQSTPDYAPYMQRIRDAKPQTLFMFTNSGRVTTAAVKGFADAGMRDAGVTLMGPGDITSDEELPNMGDAVLGTITAAIYSAHSPRPQNVEFVKAWKQQYGKDSTPNFMAVCGWDGMAAIVATVKALNGKVTGDTAIEYLKHWKNPESPRGPIAIDPETRDIVQDIYINKVERVNGRLANVEVETVHGVKDPWKTLNPK
jgi:branched-chain amino acid transport system substrate-binding protein